MQDERHGTNHDSAVPAAVLLHGARPSLSLASAWLRCPRARLRGILVRESPGSVLPAFPTLDAALAAGPVDILHVPAPSPAGDEEEIGRVVLDALKRGCDVLISPAHRWPHPLRARLQREAKRRGVRLRLFRPWLFAPAAARLFEFLESGVAGPVRSIRIEISPEYSDSEVPGVAAGDAAATLFWADMTARIAPFAGETTPSTEPSANEQRRRDLGQGDEYPIIRRFARRGLTSDLVNNPRLSGAVRVCIRLTAGEAILGLPWPEFSSTTDGGSLEIVLEPRDAAASVETRTTDPVRSISPPAFPALDAAVRYAARLRVFDAVDPLVSPESDSLFFRISAPPERTKA